MGPIKSDPPLTLTTLAPHMRRLRTSTYTPHPASRTSSSTSTHLRTLSWSPLGNFIATGAGDRSVRVWNPEKTAARSSTEFKGHTASVEGVAFCPVNNNLLVSVGSEGVVRLWDVRMRKGVGEVAVGQACLGVSWRGDGKEVLVGTKVGTSQVLFKTMA
jgi:THO complex subunit 3